MIYIFIGGGVMWYKRESHALENKIIDILGTHNGLTDQEIVDKTNIPLHNVRALCGQLVFKDKIERKRTEGSGMKNYLKAQ